VVVQVADDTVNGRQSGHAAGSPAPLAGHEFVSSRSLQRSDQDRLDQPLVFDGCRELFQGRLVEVVAWLVDVGLKSRDVQGHYFCFVFGFDIAAFDEYIKPASKPAFFHGHILPADVCALGR
jgi:hypothetical protein